MRGNSLCHRNQFVSHYNHTVVMSIVLLLHDDSPACRTSRHTPGMQEVLALTNVHRDTLTPGTDQWFDDNRKTELQGNPPGRLAVGRVELLSFGGIDTGLQQQLLA